MPALLPEETRKRVPERDFETASALQRLAALVRLQASERREGSRSNRNGVFGIARSDAECRA
jgi:hypothetical protein